MNLFLFLPQESLDKRRQELYENPMWSAWNGFFPYLLPLLGPLISLFLLLLIGPCVIRWIASFVNNCFEALLARPLQIHYHQLELNEHEKGYYHTYAPTGPYDDDI